MFEKRFNEEKTCVWLWVCYINNIMYYIKWLTKVGIKGSRRTRGGRSGKGYDLGGNVKAVVAAVTVWKHWWYIMYSSCVG